MKKRIQKYLGLESIERNISRLFSCIDELQANADKRMGDIQELQKINNDQKEVIGALLEYLHVKHKYEKVPDPTRIVLPQPTIKKLVFYKREEGKDTHG